jgi:hypothetical protein
MDEMGAYEETYEQDLMAAVTGSLPISAWKLKGSTSGGPRGLFYHDWKDIKAGVVDVIYLFRRWMDRAENVLPRGHHSALVADQGELVLSDEERALGLSEDQARWRRRKLHDFKTQAYGDENHARGMFWREHPERDDYCFLPLGNPEINLEAIERLRATCRVPLEQALLPGGIRLRFWEYPRVGGKYVAGMDPASGQRGGDYLSLQIVDQRRGVHVAELHGICPVARFTEASCELAARYNHAILSIEANGNGLAAIEIARRIEYPKLFRRPARKIGVPEPYGFYTTRESKARMYHHAKDGLTSGELLTYCADLIDDMATYDPESDHCPDRLSAFMIAQEVGRNDRGELAAPVDQGQRSRWEDLREPARQTVGFWGF